MSDDATTATADETIVREYLPGHWYWADLQTRDMDGATAFYTSIFGWETHDSSGSHGIYRHATINGKYVAGMLPQAAHLEEQGLPPFWFSYVTVEDIDATSLRVGDCGGTLVSGPFSVGDAGRMTIVQDPSGAHFALWQAGDQAGSELRNVPGTLCWNELHSNDLAPVLPFYAKLLGWTYDEMPMGEEGAYYVAKTHDDEGGMTCGLMQQFGEEAETGVPSHWAVYFAVDDADATANRVRELGGTVLHGPEDIPGIGRFAALLDPQGGAFNILDPVAPEAR